MFAGRDARRLLRRLRVRKLVRPLNMFAGRDARRLLCRLRVRRLVRSLNMFAGKDARRLLCRLRVRRLVRSLNMFAGRDARRLLCRSRVCRLVKPLNRVSGRMVRLLFRRRRVCRSGRLAKSPLFRVPVLVLDISSSVIGFIPRCTVAVWQCPKESALIIASRIAGVRSQTLYVEVAGCWLALGLTALRT